MHSTMEKAAVKILVTGATGYALVPMIARGLMLGPNQPVILYLLGPERAVEALNGLKLELIDSAFPLLKGIVATSNVVEACKDVNIAILVAGAACKEGMQRKDVLPQNISIFKTHGSALDQHAAPNCKVLVVANPANTNALILKEFAPSISPKNITCLTRLDHNRALTQLSEQVNLPVTDVKNVIIWGNHSITQYPDANYAMVATRYGEKPIKDVLADEQWLHSKFVTSVQLRGDNVLKIRKKSSALSAASAACDHIRDWVLGTPKGTWVSMGIYSDGSYGIQPGLMYSFPVTCQNGEWSIVQGVDIDEHSREKMDNSAEELIMEKSFAYPFLRS